MTQTVVTLSTPGTGTWTSPSDIPVGTTAIIECWGGGGAGCAGQVGVQTAGGGAGGAYAKKTVTINPSTGYTYTVGAGGSPKGTNGGNTKWINSSPVCEAAGGPSRNTSTYSGAIAATSGSSTGDTIYLGGNGGSGFMAKYNFGGGGGGSSGGTSANGAAGSNGTDTTGGAGGTVAGGGSGGAGAVSGNGSNGTAPGGGGGGFGYLGNASGTGGDGQIKITYDVTVAGISTTKAKRNPGGMQKLGL